jgi:3-deoxy-D-manno-octulosonic-acid transferase
LTLLFHLKIFQLLEVVREITPMNQIQSHAPPVRAFGFKFGHLFYRLIWRIMGPLLPVYLARRSQRGKEDPLRLIERQGRTELSAPQGPLIWIHGASVGESLSALPLISRLLEANEALQILVTTGTVTSANLLKERLPQRCRHQYIPLDHPRFVKAFLDHWRPQCVIWLESEFWPGILKEISDRNLPMALVNARLSDQSFERWQRRPGLIGPLLSSFDLCLAQDSRVAEKLHKLGAHNVSSPGNLKFTAPPLPDDESLRMTLSTDIGARPLILAAQTAKGEEETIGRIHLHLKTQYEDLLTIIAPRHPERVSDIEAVLKEQGLIVSVRSRKEALSPQCDIYLADTMGELGAFYRLGAKVFLGRSLVPGHGGSNALEPARLGCALVQGPYTENFNSVNALLEKHEASLVALDDLALCNILDDLLDNANMAAELGQRAEATARSAEAVLDKILIELNPIVQGLIEKEGEQDART